MKNIKKKIWDNRGKICFGVGAAVGGIIAYRYLGQDLKHAQDTINKLNEALADTDKYAKTQAKIMSSVILDMAYDYLIEMDESPEMIASEIAFDVIYKCKDKVFDNPNAFIQCASNNLGEVVEIMKTDKDILPIHEIPEGTYGSVEITHF